MQIGASGTPRELLALQHSNAQRPQARAKADAAAPAARDSFEASTDIQRPGKALGIQKIVEAGRAIPAAPHSRVGAAIAQAAIEPDSQFVPPSGEPTGGDPNLFGAADVDRLNAIWGLRAGDEGFDATLDFDGDGVISGTDLGVLLLNFGQPKPTQDDVEPSAEEPSLFGASDVDRLNAIWGLRAGDEGFDATLDFDGDGVISGNDLGLLLLNYGQPKPVQDDPEPPTGGELTPNSDLPTKGDATGAATEPDASATTPDIAEAAAASPQPAAAAPTREESLAEIRSALRDQLGALLRASMQRPGVIQHNAQTLLEVLGREGARSL